MIQAASHVSSLNEPQRRFDSVPTPIAPKLAIHALLLARVLLRRQALGEPLRSRIAERAYGAPIEHDKVERALLTDVPRIRRGHLGARELEEVIRSGVPTVLEGAGLDAPAIARWTPRFFAERFGDTPIPLFPEHSASGTLPLRDCIRHIEDGDKPEIQVNNVCDLLTAPHGLLRELPVARLRGQVRSVRYHGANLFICGAGNGSKYHCANELNFFFQVYGEKEWFFVHPKYTPQMDPHFTQPRCNYFGSGVAWGEQPRGVPIGRALLRPGDILVNPPWWWHWVRNRTTTIGVATRWYSWRHRCGTDNVYFSLLQWLFPHQWRLMWSDYVRGGCLDDRKWVHR